MAKWVEIKFMAYNQPHTLRLVGWPKIKKIDKIITKICNTATIKNINYGNNENNF